MERAPVKMTLAIAVTGLVLTMTVLVSGLLIASQKIPNTGNVKAIGVDVYSDSACTIPITLIEWGTVNPGTTKNFTIYVKNEGNVAIMLSIETDNWDPLSASSYLTLSWNRAGYVLSSGSSVRAVLSLSVSSSISGVENFSFDIMVIGTEST
jgi:hypothetical protein